MKKLLFATLLVMLSVATAYSQPNTEDGDLKFGVHLKSIIPGNKIGAFVEYKIHESFGLQGGVSYFSDYYIMDISGDGTSITGVAPKYLSIPLLLREYSGADRQFCFFVGLQTSYLIGGDLFTVEMLNTGVSSRDAFEKIIEEKNQGASLKKLKDIDESKLSNWALHFVWGFDYEFSQGFQLGVEVGHGLTTVIECKNTMLNWTSKLALGYNFAKLF